MEKPIEIVEFEKKYRILMTESSNENNKFSYSEKNTFLCDDIRQIIGLNLNENQLIEIPDLSHFPFLQYLNLSDNQISETKGLESLTQLSELYLGYNQIKEIIGLEGLPQLTTLDLSRNQIREIKGLEGLPQLTRLYLNRNQINEIKGLEGLPLLTSLYLGSNQIKEIKGLEGLPQLLILYLVYNQIREIKGLEFIPQLIGLYLNSNQIREIKGLEFIPQLTTLNLGSNQISEIKGLEGLPQLTELYLHNNQIREIKGFVCLPQLTELYLHNNQIKEIKGFEGLMKLSKLNLENNKISDISSLYSLIEKGIELHLDNVNKEKSINIRFNRLEEGVLSILSIKDKVDKQKALLAYIQNKKQSERPFREAKLMLLGEGEAGKTNFRNYIMGLPFDDSKSATTGIAIDRKKIVINENDYRINIWDFGGQWIQQQLHKFFITSESIYVIILNARNNEEPTKWLKWIQSYTTDSKAFVVVNKVDDNFSHQLNENKLKEEYPFIEGFFYISLRDAAKEEAAKSIVDKLWQQIQQSILFLKNIESPVASNYHDLKNELEDHYLKNRTHIDFSTYEELFEKFNALGDKEILLKVLEKIGTVRYFSNFDKLILNPEWLSGGVYKILMSKKASKELFGIIHNDDLESIMCETRNNEDKFSYRESDQQFIIQMMKDFELAYINDVEKIYFIPSLFKPDISADLIKEEVYNHPDVHFTFEFKNAAFPEELISKFIVRFFNKKHKEFYWKNGIMLIDKDDELAKSVYAYIESDKDNRTIDIKMKGAHSRNFFKDIKKQIMSLLENTNFEYDQWLNHSEYGKLDYEDYVFWYKEGVNTRKERVGNKSVEVNIAEILGLVNNERDLKSMKEESNEKYDFRGAQIGNLVIDSEKFTQYNYHNNYQNSPEIAEIKSMLQELIENPDLKDIKDFQEKWLGEFIETLRLVKELEIAGSQAEEIKAKSALKQFYDLGKEINDWKNIVSLPFAMDEFFEKVAKFF